MNITYVATCLFGLEHLLGEEIEALGYNKLSTINGRVTFLGDEEEITAALDKSAEELSRVLASFEAKELSDIQPMDDDGELFQDPGAFDSINFLVRDLESEDKIYCHCNKKGERGEYSLRFTDEGIRVVCDRCAAFTDLYLKSQAAAEEYLSLDELTLK